MIQSFDVRFGFNVVILGQGALNKVVDTPSNVALIKLNIVRWKV